METETIETKEVKKVETEKIIISQADLDLNAFCEIENKRNLNHVRVTQKFSEASDGKMMVRITECETKADDYPQIEEGTGVKEVLIPSETARKTKLPKSHISPIDRKACLSRTSDDTVFMSFTDLENKSSVSIPYEEEIHWPDTDRVFPEKTDYQHLAVDARLLDKLCKYVIKHHNDYDSVPSLHIYFHRTKSDQVVEFNFDMQKNRNGAALLMPLNIDKE